MPYVPLASGVGSGTGTTTNLHVEVGRGARDGRSATAGGRRQPVLVLDGVGGARALLGGIPFKAPPAASRGGGEAQVAHALGGTASAEAHVGHDGQNGDHQDDASTDQKLAIVLHGYVVAIDHIIFLLVYWLIHW
jgi:hypothetical protein